MQIIRKPLEKKTIDTSLTREDARVQDDIEYYSAIMNLTKNLFRDTKPMYTNSQILEISESITEALDDIINRSPSSILSLELLHEAKFYNNQAKCLINEMKNNQQ